MEEIEKEAQEAALKMVVNMMQRPGQLEKVTLKSVLLCVGQSIHSQLPTNLVVVYVKNEVLLSVLIS